MIGEHVLLKVSLIKGVMRFKKKGKLNLSYIVCFFIVECNSNVFDIEEVSSG